MVAPFQKGRNLLRDACPIQQVIEEIQTQLAEFKALKEAGPVLGPA